MPSIFWCDHSYISFGVKGTQSRYLCIYQLSGKSAMNKLFTIAIQTSQCLLLSVYFSAFTTLHYFPCKLSLLHMLSNQFFFRATLFQVSIREAG